jgi:hypothetical protein
MASDDLVGDRVEVAPGIAGLRRGLEHVIAGAPDQPRLPAGGLGADRVLAVARHPAHLGRLRAERLGDLGIGLQRRLVALGRVVAAEAAVEQVDQPAMGQLAAGDGPTEVNTLTRGTPCKRPGRKPAARPT